MTEFSQSVDQRAIGYYVEQAHAERADALAKAFGVVGRQIKNIFSSPEVDVGCKTCGSNA